MNKNVVLEFLHLLTEEVEEGIKKAYKRITRRYHRRAEDLLSSTKISVKTLPLTMTGVPVQVRKGFEGAITRYQQSLATKLLKSNKIKITTEQLPNWKTVFVAGCIIAYIFFSSQLQSGDKVAGSSDEKVMRTVTVVTSTPSSPDKIGVKSGPTDTPTPTPVGPTPTNTPTPIPAPVVKSDTEPVIDCTGPDGKHLWVTQKACTDFNNAWRPTPTPTPRQTKVKRIRITCPDNARSVDGAACVCEKNHYWDPRDNKCIRFRN